MAGRIVVGSDHAGYELKDSLAQTLRDDGWDVVDVGTTGPASVDYPDFATAVAETVLRGDAEFGLLVCGTGIGISIAANRHKGIRAALCHDVTGARLSRQHNDANVLVLGARMIGAEVARDCLRTFLSTLFEGGRHAARVAKLG